MRRVWVFDEKQSVSSAKTPLWVEIAFGDIGGTLVIAGEREHLLASLKEAVSVLEANGGRAVKYMNPHAVDATVGEMISAALLSGEKTEEEIQRIYSGVHPRNLSRALREMTERGAIHALVESDGGEGA